MLSLILLSLVAVSLCNNPFYSKDPVITEQFIKELKQKASFEVADYDSNIFKDFSLHDFHYKLGLIPSKHLRPSEVFYGDDSDLPTQFDSRVNWPGCVHDIRDQAKCGSCWAFALSEVLSDRFCISTAGKTNTVLSAQESVSCDKRNFGCNGGQIYTSWEYARRTGLVTEQCFPYTSAKGSVEQCHTAAGKCVDKNSEAKRYKVAKHGHLRTIADAKRAIFTEGPIETGFMVYRDFTAYKGGVYKHQYGGILGGHAVKIVGWGVENGEEHWIVANSWNTTWGEKGYFRIAFGEAQFEHQMWAGSVAAAPEQDNDKQTVVADSDDFFFY